MVRLDPIWSRARADLVTPTAQGEVDLFLWEHSVRVSQSALQISKLPILRSQSPDDAAIVAAGLYHDAGWVVRLKDGEIERSEILVRSCPDTHREQGAAMMESALAGLLPSDSLERASQAIRTLNARDIESVEGRVVTEAENLDEFGILSLWTAIRRGALEGKGWQAVIDTWRRRKEYHFWTARLNDSFRFGKVRELAKERLASVERFMEDLEAQHQCRDGWLGSAPPPAAEHADRSRPE